MLKIRTELFTFCSTIFRSFEGSSVIDFEWKWLGFSVLRFYPFLKSVFTHQKGDFSVLVLAAVCGFCLLKHLVFGFWHLVFGFSFRWCGFRVSGLALIHPRPQGYSFYLLSFRRPRDQKKWRGLGTRMALIRSSPLGRGWRVRVNDPINFPITECAPTLDPGFHSFWKWAIKKWYPLGVLVGKIYCHRS